MFGSILREFGFGLHFEFTVKPAGMVQNSRTAVAIEAKWTERGFG